MARLTFVIDSDLGEVTLLAVASRRVCLHLGLNEVKAGEVELCLVEAVTNVIRHSYHGEAGNTIEISVSSSLGRLCIEVFDSGTPMGTEHVRRLIHGTDWDESAATSRTLLKEGGRGLQIIHDLMDEIAYTQVGNRNQLSLMKRI